MSELKNYDRLTEERINGVIYLMARPNRQHLRIQYNICRLFNDYFTRENKKCEAIFEDEVRINKDNKIVPDVLVYCYDDCNNTDDENNNGYDLPLIVVEVLSKSTRKKDFTVKMKKYAELGVKEYWIADYKSSVMDIYILENGQYDLKFSCGIDDENVDGEEDEADEHKDLVAEFSPALFPDMTVKAKDVFYSVK